MLRYAARAIGPAGIFVDIGAGTGSTARAFAKRAGLDPSHCHLIEPDPKNFEIMREESPGYVCSNVAIAAISGEMTLYSYDDPSWRGSSKSNTLFREVLHDKGVQGKIYETKVQAKTIDRYLDDAGIAAADMIWMNCEGAEYEIFGEHLSWLHRTRILWVDLHGRSPHLLREFGAKRVKIFDLIAESGFELVGGHKRGDIPGMRGHATFLFERPSAQLND